MDADSVDHFIAGFLKLDLKHVTAEKQRELAIQIRSFNLERHSSRQLINQTIEDLCRKIEWHFEMLNSYEELYKNYTVAQLDEQQLISDTQIKIPRNRVVHKQIRSVPQLHQIKARMKNVPSLHSTLTSTSSPTLPHFGNISSIGQKNHITLHYKGNRRSSLKAKAMQTATNRRSKELNLSGNTNRLRSEPEVNESDVEQSDQDQPKHGFNLNALMAKIDEKTKTKKKESLNELQRELDTVRLLVEHQFDTWIDELDPNIANRLIKDCPNIEFIV